MTQQEFRTFRVGSFTSVMLCTICLGVVAFLLLIAGAIITGMWYTEVRPPAADENYNRYRGADLRKVIGPLMLAVGVFLLLGGCIFAACTCYSHNKDEEASYMEASRNYDGNGGQQKDTKVSKY